jgi:hypothetical protein
MIRWIRGSDYVSWWSFSSFRGAFGRASSRSWHTDLKRRNDNLNLLVPISA